jgi:hypothetical protein
MTRKAGVAGVLAAGFVVLVNYVDGLTDLRLLAFLAIAWALGVWLVGRNLGAVRRCDTEVRALFVVFVAGLPPLAVHDGLSLPAELRSVLWLLIVGVTLAAAGIGLEVGQSEPTE